jgi:hypothetical protein
VNPQPGTSGRLSISKLAVLVLACAWFLARGPLRGLTTGGRDFAAPYVSSLRFIEGRNPYSHDDFMQSWIASGAPPSSAQNPSGQRSLYPPTTLPVMLPFALLPWPLALAAFEALCVLMFAHCLYRLAATVGDGWNSWARTSFVACGLTLSPIQTGLSTANVSVLGFLLCLYSLLYARDNKWIQVGALLGLALCLKPNIAIVVFAYFLFSRRWKLLSVSAGLACILTAAAFLRMQSLPRIWIVDYKSNFAYVFGAGGVADFASPSSARFDMLNLQVPLFQILHTTKATNLTTYSLVAVLTLVWLILFLHNPKLEQGWAAPAALLLLGLLPIYQRNYNAGFVLLALLWGFQHFHSATGKCVVAVSAVFLFPGEASLRQTSVHVAWLQGNSLWLEAGLFPHATWAILVLALILMHVMATAPTQSPERRPRL